MIGFLLWFPVRNRTRCAIRTGGWCFAPGECKGTAAAEEACVLAKMRKPKQIVLNTEGMAEVTRQW